MPKEMSGKWRRINNRLVNIEKLFNIPRPTFSTLNTQLLITKSCIRLPVDMDKHYSLSWVISPKDIIFNVGIGIKSSGIHETLRSYVKEGKKWVKINSEPSRELLPSRIRKALLWEIRSRSEPPTESLTRDITEMRMALLREICSRPTESLTRDMTEPPDGDED